MLHSVFSITTWNIKPYLKQLADCPQQILNNHISLRTVIISWGFKDFFIYFAQYFWSILKADSRVEWPNNFLNVLELFSP